LAPPPIRYPLPTLAGLLLLGVLAWRGAEIARPAWESLAERFRKATAGPDFPKSDEPRMIAGPIRDRVLLLRDATVASDTPGGTIVETIGRRMFADVYDVWPIEGEPSHYRIGNREPIGWVEARDVLRWPTRLVARSERVPIAAAASPGSAATGTSSSENSPRPILGWKDGEFQVAEWGPGRAWESVDRVQWTGFDRSRLGVLLSRQEVVALLGRMLSVGDGPTATALRLRAVSGRLLDGQSVAGSDIEAARSALPAAVFEPGTLSTGQKTDALARLNESWSPDAAWGGLEFRAVPLDLLP
jgi:hypothetical protein